MLQLVSKMVFLGFLLIITGVFFLLKNLGIISAAFWGIFWPTILILLGIKLLLHRQRWHRFWNEFSRGKKIKIE